MALVFLDGFDHYATAQLQAKWPSGGNVISTNIYYIAQGAGREAGGGALHITNSGGSWNPPWIAIPAQATYTFGLALSWSAIAGGQIAILCSSGTTQLLVGLNSSGYVFATVKAGTYTATTPVLAQNTWYYVEGQIVVSATAGSVTVRVNGNTVISETSIDTDSAGSGTCNQFGLAADYLPNPNSTGVQGYYDDLYLFDGAGSANTTFPSAIPTVQCLWPNAPGTNAQWTGLPYASGNNFANVNDETPDGDFTVNQSGTVGNLDTFKHDELRPPSGTVFAIQHCITARTSTATSHSVAAAEYTGGTAYVDTGQTLPTGYTCATFPHDTDPATGAAYTVADVNAAEFGYELTA
jgi:hypothetical protein